MSAARERSAVVTGAASGIGRATVELLHEHGYGVVALDVSTDRFDWVGDRDAIVPLAGDVTDQGSNVAAVELAIEQWGRLDVSVLNAGVVGAGSLERFELAGLDRVLAVNVRGVALGIGAAIPAMRAGRGGSIVVTASTSGLGGEPGRWPYNTSKAAVINLVRCAAIDLALDGIRVNAVCPGPTHTGLTDRLRDTDRYDALRAMIPLQRWAEPREVAEAIAFLASPAASFITGVALPVDGGITAGNAQALPPQRAD